MRKIPVIIITLAASNYLIRYGLLAAGIEVGPVLAFGVLAATSLFYCLIHFRWIQPSNRRPHALTIYRWVGVLGLLIILNIWSLAFRDMLPMLWAYGGPFWIPTGLAIIICLLSFRKAKRVQRKA